jgi:transcriptional regulator with XRE-family HTH domain
MATKTAITIGKAAKDARDKRGMSQADAAFATRQLPEPYWLDQSKISRIERNAPVDPEDVLVLATIYGVTIGSLSAEAADAIDGLRLLLTRTPAWFTGDSPFDGGTAERPRRAAA